MSDLKIFPWAVRPCFMSIPLDILQHILSWASPCDLQALRLVCRTLQNYIDFDCSMANILFPVPAPTLHAWFKLSMLPALLFGGGKCMMSCEFSALQRIPPTPKRHHLCRTLPRNALPGLEHRNTLPVPLPYLEGSSELHLYAPAQVSAAWSRFAEQYKESNVVAMPQLPRGTAGQASQLVDPTLEHWMATAELLCAGARQYRIAKEDVDAENETILRRLAQELGRPVKQVVASPTLARWVNIFSRDLQAFPHQGMSRAEAAFDGPNRPLDSVEINPGRSYRRTRAAGVHEWFGHSLHLLSTPKRARAPLLLGGPPATHCELVRTNSTLRSAPHSVCFASHPEQVAEPITDRFQRCRLCPTKKTKSYDRPSMLKHISALLVLLLHLLFLDSHTSPAIFRIECPRWPP
ncbi:hypothetical protein FB451DRAFT_1322992 [Mycena latifolia]|nr:hypothetical protein FB451DRAFT_1322992 [Mycena latifolia]